mmetsp:Transcript_24229/g.49032  ORF Transcript_24229/g.49032 Transcript_24229/m.49032 type:complete len:279 (-) Transcript_24229:2469-3305(-)
MSTLPSSLRCLRTCLPRQHACTRRRRPPTAGFVCLESLLVAMASSSPTKRSCNSTLRTVPPRLCAALPPPSTMTRCPSRRSRGSTLSSVDASLPSMYVCITFFSASTATVTTCQAPARSTGGDGAAGSAGGAAALVVMLLVSRTSLLAAAASVALVTPSDVPTAPVSPTYTLARCSLRELPPLPATSLGEKRTSAACCPRTGNEFTLSSSVTEKGPSLACSLPELPASSRAGGGTKRVSSQPGSQMRAVCLPAGLERWVMTSSSLAFVQRGHTYLRHS